MAQNGQSFGSRITAESMAAFTLNHYPRKARAGCEGRESWSRCESSLYKQTIEIGGLMARLTVGFIAQQDVGFESLPGLFESKRGCRFRWEFI